ncbi:MAG: pyridoxal phosphate-dependent aminotransferase [Massiliimalia sp.]|jgi:threonine-phosphate decarboxylase
MVKLVHGGDIYSPGRKVLDFSANINPLGMPEPVRQALYHCAEACEHYPDPLCRDLTRVIGEKEGCPPQWILCGNGAADVIFRLVFSQKPKKAAVLAPTFAEYEAALQAVGCTVVSYQLNPKEDFIPGEGFLRWLSQERPDMVFVCNPNNPTGQLLAEGVLEQAAALCQSFGALFVVDECFLDFVVGGEAQSGKPFLSKYPIFLLKAFTKMYAMPGIRLGYGICADTALLEHAAACGQPWSVSVPAQAAGIAAYGMEGFEQQTRDYVASARKDLQDGLRRRGMKVWDSCTNYVLFYIEDKCLRKKLEQQDILIRDCSNYRGLTPGYYRTAVRTPEENQRLLQALDQIMNNTDRGNE